MIIEVERKKTVKSDIELKGIKEKISEAMKYFFYFVDLVFISFILFKNTIQIVKFEVIHNKILYISMTTVVIFIGMYCIHKINENVSNKNNIRDKKDLVEKIIEIKGYKNKVMDSRYKKVTNFFYRSIVRISLKRTILLGIFMFIVGFLSLQNKCVEIHVASISVFYFLMRPVHYSIVFYIDFKNKIHKTVVDSSDQKMRYITLALSNYVKIILEFCILIYILKYMGWAFVNIEINTFFELVYLIVVGNLDAITSIEMFINLLRIVSLGIVLTLNLSTYMALEVVNKNIDKSK